MSSDPTIQKLDLQRADLLRRICRLEPTDTSPLPTDLRLLDRTSAAQLAVGLGFEPGFHPATTQFVVEVIKRSEEGRKLFLNEETDALRAVEASQTDQVIQSEAGIVEGLFPVTLRGHLLHVFSSGKLLQGPCNAEAWTQYAKTLNLSEELLVSRAASLPALGEEEIERIFMIYRKMRDAVEQALAHQLEAAERTEQLVQAERMQTLGTLAGGVAHHFNTLLPVVLGKAAQIMNHEEISPQTREALRNISEAAQRGRRLTDEIQAYAGSEVDEPTPCAIHKTLTSVLALLQPQWPDSLHVETHLSAEEDLVLAPPGVIRQIVFNLLASAAETTSEHSSLSIQTGAVALDPSTPDQRFLRLEISERPPASALPDETESSPLDLKLSNIYGMVKRLDGTLMISTRPDNGFQIEILLPLIASTSEQTPPTASHRVAPSTVWVVDDDPIFLRMCQQVLRDDGHTVTDLNDAACLQTCWASEAPKPDILIVDFILPDSNGLELIRWLREHGCDAPVILVSGYNAGQPEIREALSLAKTFFLQKPFSVPDLDDLVTVALGETLLA